MMSTFRREFYSTLQDMSQLTKNILLQDVFPPTAPHNISARILRLGIAVNAFAMLEEYLRSIFESLASEVSSTPIAYNLLSNKLKTFFLVDALRGINNKIKYTKDKDQKIAIAERAIVKVFEFGKTPPSYTHYGFGSVGSNIGPDDINNGFMAFGASSIWITLNQIASTFGAQSVNLENDYRTFSQSRNTSAHDPTSNIPTLDLQARLRTAVVIGISSDILANQIRRCFLTSHNPQQLASALASSTHRLRLVDEQIDGSWLERSSASARGMKRHPAKASAIATCLGRANVDWVVIRDTGGSPIELIGN